MARKFLTGIDLVQNQALNMALQNLGSAPSSPVAGQVYYDTTLNALRNYNAVSTAWELQATNSLLLQGQNGAYYLARANQSGAQLAATISNLQSTVIGYTLDTFAQPVAAMNFNGQRLTNIGTCTSASDAAPKSYVDATVQGLTPKPTAQVATAAALPTNSYNNGSTGVGATLTATGVGALTVDSYVVNTGDIVLVKNEVATANNGEYVVTNTGTGSAPYVLTRHVDMDQSGEFGGGFIAVENKGSTTANTLWLCNASNSITVGTTAVAFTQLNAATSYSQGNGISISGNTVTAVAAAGIVVTSGGIGLDTTIAVRKYAGAIGDGSATSYTVTHNLNTQDVTVGIYAAATPYAEVEADVSHATVNTLTVAFAAAPSAGQYRVVVHG